MLLKIQGEINMGIYKSVIVAIDINAEYEKIIKKALKVCKSVDCIRLAYIPLPSIYLQPYLYGADANAFDDSSRIERAQKKLESIAKKFKISQEHVFLKTGDAADEIKSFANDMDADLIVIGTHGQSGLKLLLGSTANAVLHGAKQDVLAVRVHESK